MGIKLDFIIGIFSKMFTPVGRKKIAIFPNKNCAHSCRLSGFIIFRMNKRSKSKSPRTLEGKVKGNNSAINVLVKQTENRIKSCFIIFMINTIFQVFVKIHGKANQRLKADLHIFPFLFYFFQPKSNIIYI